MNLQLIKQPGNYNLSGMPLIYILSLLGYGVAEKSRDIKVNVTIMVEAEYNSDIFTEAKQQDFYPDQYGKVIMDAKSIADAYVKYFVPPLNLDRTAVCGINITRVKIKYQLNDNGTLSNGIESTPCTVMKGGVPDAIWTKDVLQNITTDIKAPLNYVSTGQVDPAAARFLYWIWANALQDAPISIKFTGTLSDGTTISNALSYIIPVQKFALFCTPIGLTKTGLIPLIPLGSILQSYTVEIMDPDGVNIINPVSYDLDYRSFYETTRMYFINSLGALEFIRIIGEVEESASYTSSFATSADNQSIFEILGILGATNQYVDLKESWSGSGNTGYINKQTAETIRGLFLSKHKYIETDGLLNPIVIDVKSAKFWTNKDNLFNVQIDWKTAKDQRYYNKQTWKPHSSCPAVESLFSAQIDKNTIQMAWSLPEPFSQIQIIITLVEGTRTFILEGNAGSKELPVLVESDQTITIEGKVICNSFSDPMELGPAKTVELAVTSISNPVAGDISVSGNSFGSIDGNGDVTLEDLNINVLDHASSPDGVDIEVANPVTSTTNTPGGKGKYQIHADGALFYASNTGAVGLDYFNYQIKNTIGNGSSTGSVKITLGGTGDDGNDGGETGMVYVNQRTFSGSSPDESNKMAFFYKDAAMSIPYDVTGKGLILNCLESIESDSKRDGPRDSATTHDITAVGTNMIIGVQDGYSYYGPDDDWEWWERRWKVLPGTGYTIV